MHSHGEIEIDLAGAYSRFISDVGVDDDIPVGFGSVGFQVYGDGAQLYSSDPLTAASNAAQVNISVAGISHLRLVVTDAGDGGHSDHAVWAGARLTSLPLPATPSGLSATDGIFANQVRVAWDPSSLASVYDLWRSNSPGSSGAPLALAVSGTSYDDTSAEPGAVYYYRVLARSGGGGVSSLSGYETGFRAFAGDYDRNLTVDGADFLLWQRGVGTIYDGDNLAAWEANFGMSGEATANVTASGTASLAATLSQNTAGRLAIAPGLIDAAAVWSRMNGYEAREASVMDSAKPPTFVSAERRVLAPVPSMATSPESIGNDALEKPSRLATASIAENALDDAFAELWPDDLKNVF